MTDRVLTAFLERQYHEGLALAAASDLLDLIPLGDVPPQRYVARYRCTGLVKADAGEIVEANHFVLGIWLPDDYLRHVEPLSVVTVLEPREIFQPNVKAPFMCLGRLPAGTSLVDILYQAFEIITYGKATMCEDDALNREACAWARRNLQRFPVDRRGLKRRTADVVADDFDIDVLEVPS